MAKFEEDSFTQLVMKKNDTRRQKQDGQDLALHGTCSSHGLGRHRGRSLEGKFEDVVFCGEDEGGYDRVQV